MESSLIAQKGVYDSLVGLEFANVRVKVLKFRKKYDQTLYIKVLYQHPYTHCF